MQIVKTSLYMTMAAVAIVSTAATTVYASSDMVAGLEKTVNELRDRLAMQQAENDALKKENKKLEREFESIKDLRNGKKVHIAEFTADTRNLIQSKAPELLEKYDKFSLNYPYELRAQNVPTTESLVTLHHRLNGTLVVGDDLANVPFSGNLTIASHDIILVSYDDDGNLVFGKPYHAGDFEFTAYFYEDEPILSLHNKDGKYVRPNSEMVSYLVNDNTYLDYLRTWYFVKPGHYTFDIDGESTGTLRVIKMPTQYLFAD